jgi:hypothetical protein
MFVGFDIKAMFFDRQAVIDRVAAATWTALQRIGQLVQRTAKASIKPRRRGVFSPPGRPPYDHVGAARRARNARRKRQGLPAVRGGFKGIRHILYGYDPANQSVVIGPVALRDVGVVPPILEYGGTETIKRGGKTVRAHYAPRPFMGPAEAKERPRFASMWANSVK